MAALLGSIAKSYIAGKVGSNLVGGGGGLSAVGNTLGNLAAGSSGDTLSPHQFNMPAGGVQFFNRQKEQQKKRRMF